MKTSVKTSAIKRNFYNQLWDEFVSYLDSIYFDGAADVLDKELVCFEYNNFVEMHS